MVDAVDNGQYPGPNEHVASGKSLKTSCRRVSSFSKRWNLVQRVAFFVSSGIQSAVVAEEVRKKKVCLETLLDVASFSSFSIPSASDSISASAWISSLSFSQSARTRLWEFSGAPFSSCLIPRDVQRAVGLNRSPFVLELVMYS